MRIFGDWGLALGGGGLTATFGSPAATAFSTFSSAGSGNWSDLKYSMRLAGQLGDGACPPNSQISAATTPCGGAKSFAGRLAEACSMIWAQIGAAPVMPLTSSISLLSLLPTHTPATRSG